MLAILYLLLCAAFGMCFVGLSVPDVRRLYVACSPSAKAITHIPNTLFTVPAGIVTGMLCVPFFNYYVTLGLSNIISEGELCKKLGVLITFAFFLWMILTCLILINRKRVKREDLKASGAAASIEDYKSNIPDSVFYGAVIVAITIAATFLMFYTYRINGTTLYNGSSTFSDLSPHTAMVSSFGKGFNFPTQYMHFSGDGIKYHFLFYFLAGTLLYLGLPIDYALNLPSIITMVSALVLLGLIAVLISSRRAAFLVAPILVLFRSSLNVFYHIKELTDAGSTFSEAIKEISKSTVWYAVTDYDGWGIWAINVYPNQRHLMLGVSVILLMVILFLPFVRRLGISISRSGGFGEGVKAFAFSKNAWLVRFGDPLYPVSITVLACVLVICMPYFHGSCLISLLLILFGMAIVSESRLLYLAVAVCAVTSSYIQTLVFSGGYKNVVSFAFEKGFILEDVTAYSLARYLFIVTGLTLILGGIFAVTALVIDLIQKKPIHRFLLFLCALNPLIFAFLVKVSLEMLANHKFIQVTLILVDAFVAALIANLLYIPFKRRKTDGAGEAAVDDDYVDAEAIDGEIAVAAAATDKSIRTPLVTAPSAFGESLENDEAEVPDIKAIEEHTGVDADISGLAVSQADTVDSGSTDKKDVIPEEIAFGDENIDNDSVSEVEAVSEEVDESDGIFEVTDDDSDDAVMASGPELGHVAMRPGSMALNVAFGEEEADDAADANIAVESANEPVEVISLPSEEDENVKPDAESLKHEPVKTKKPKGLSFASWIALEIAGVILALALMVPLTATGLSEWATYINLNHDPLTMDANSPVTKWVMENTDPSDAFLTPMWSMNRFILAGRPMYYGWPYYAWSAGHDTYTRDTIYLWLITGCGEDIDEFTRYCKERHIRYLIVDPDFEETDFGNGITFNKRFFEENLTQAAYYAEENTTIYKIY
ncbi:MAG: hypothetical protein K5779_10105 [Saccharofermentans sp.]|nr:hypothetical protein [Saccharofermentans sp.]